MQLKDKVAVVLGASAAGGTGWAIAEALAAEGAKVVVGARRREPLEQLAKKIRGMAVVCDAGKGEQIAAFAKAAVDAYGPVDIAVNSAARPVVGLISETKPEDVQRALDVNFLGQVNFIRETAAVMRDGGSIIIIGAASAMQPVMPFFPYSCAKAATDCLVRYAAMEYGARGIRVNSILPGPIKTELAAHVFESPGTEAVFNREIPLGRIGYPNDFAQVVVWLAGPNYITGVNMPVSGGLHLTRVPRQDELPGGSTYNNKLN